MSHFFARCAIQKTHGRARTARVFRAILAYPCVFSQGAAIVAAAIVATFAAATARQPLPPPLPSPAAAIAATFAAAFAAITGGIYRQRCPPPGSR